MIWFEWSEMKRKSDIFLYTLRRQKKRQTRRWHVSYLFYFFAYNELCVVEIGNSKENKFDIIEERASCARGREAFPSKKSYLILLDILFDKRLFRTEFTINIIGFHRLDSYYLGNLEMQNRKPVIFITSKTFEHPHFPHQIKICLCLSFCCIISWRSHPDAKKPETKYIFSSVMAETTKLMPQTGFRSQRISTEI